MIIVAMAAVVPLIVALIFLVRARAWTLWDTLSLIVPVALWFLLIGTGLRSKSLSNLAELFLLFLIVGVCLLVRAVAFRSQSNVRRSQFALTIALIASVTIYASVPLLQE
jgi:hypothetical protein